MLQQPLHIVMIEDDEVDVEAMHRLIAQERLHVRLSAFPNGLAAQQALQGSLGEFLQHHPYLILLDINMARMNGHEFLTWLRADRRFAKALVFIVTTSDAPRDILTAYEQHIAGYFLKQRLGSALIGLASVLASYSAANLFPPA